MIPEHVLEKLRLNWGLSASGLHCDAEVCLYCEAPLYRAYLYALDPNDNDTVLSFTVSRNSAYLEELSMNELVSRFDCFGDFIKVDTEYRAVSLQQLMRRYQITDYPRN